MKIKTDPTKRGIGKVVLIVDDSDIIRKIVADAFLSDGFKTCVEGENGREAIEAAKQFKPDVIILDLSMPVMNGLEAASELKQISPKTPIILFTLYGQEFINSQISQANVDLVLPKSTPLSALVKKAHELIGS